MQILPELTHIGLASFLWDIDKQCRPGKTPLNAASDQCLHCLLQNILLKFGENE